MAGILHRGHRGYSSWSLRGALTPGTVPRHASAVELEAALGSLRAAPADTAAVE